MKRFLLFAAFALAMIPWLAAETATLTFPSNATSSNPADINNAAGQKVAELVIKSNSKGLLQKGATGYLQFLQGYTLTITGEEGITITEAVFTVTSDSKVTSFDGMTVNPGQVSGLTWSGSANSFSIKRTTGSGMKLTGVTLTYETAGAAEVEAFTSDPAAGEDGETITVTKGTEVKFTAKNASKIDYEISANTGDITGTVDGETYTYTATEGAIISLKAYDAEGTVKQEATYSVELKAAELCGAVTFDPTSGSEIEAGTEVTISCENAVKITYAIDDAAAVVAQGNTAKVAVSKACTIKAYGTNADGKDSETAQATYTIKAAELCGEVTFDPASGSVIYVGSQVTISCENAVKITYNVGEAEAVTADGNSVKVTVNEPCTIKAYGTNADDIDSEEAVASYTIKALPATSVLTFDFTTTDIKAWTTNTTVTPGSGNSKDATNNLTGVTFENEGVSIAFYEKEGSSINIRWWKPSSGDTHIRAYNNTYFTITTPTNSEITEVAFTQSSGGTDWTDPTTTPTGTWSDKWPKTWTPSSTEAQGAPMRAEAAKNTVTFTPTAKTFFATVMVSYVNTGTTGIENITVDADAPVEYYDLQGRRVAHPANGIFIRRQGNTVTKVAF